MKFISVRLDKLQKESNITHTDYSEVLGLLCFVLFGRGIGPGKKPAKSAQDGEVSN